MAPRCMGGALLKKAGEIMEYYVDRDGQVIGRLYQCGKSWAAEVGRQSELVMSGFVATKGIKTDSHRAAEKFLLENGCVSVAVA